MASLYWNLTMASESLCLIGPQRTNSGLQLSRKIHSFRRRKVVCLLAILKSPNADFFSVLVLGPYLVRGAKLSGSKLAITGDVVNATSLEVFAPKSVKSVTWNGKKVSTQSTEYGSLKASLKAPKSVKLPAFSSWKSNDSLPERFTAYDDSGVAWVGRFGSEQHSP
jgi:hypothetical protein